MYTSLKNKSIHHIAVIGRRQDSAISRMRLGCNPCWYRC